MEEVFYLVASVVGGYSGRVYGSTGDQVNLIAIHDNVAIVEKGIERFTVNVTSISKESIEPDSAKKAASPSGPGNRTQKKAKKAPVRPKSLFE